VFELKGFSDGVCIRDTATVLVGGASDPMTPVCGNMTSHSTSFAVTPGTSVSLAIVTQGIHRYSIQVTQIPCKDIPHFASGTLAGLRNDDAERYIPPPTTKKPKTKLKKLPTTRDNETSEEITTEGTVTEETTTETIIETTTVEAKEEDQAEGLVETVTKSSGPEDTKEQTTLKVGVIPTRKPNRKPDIIIEEEYIMDLDAVDVTPVISVFRRAFSVGAGDRCWQLEKPQEEDGFRIIGGFRTNLHKYPWQVALVHDKKFFCGGALVSDRHVLTAAHCVFGSFDDGIQKLRISLGDHDLATRADTNNTVSRVKRVLWHMNYSPHTNIHDIALFELETPVVFSKNISSVRLPSSDDDFSGQNATVTGWGRYKRKLRKTSPVLKEYTGLVVPPAMCAKAWKKFPGIVAYKDRHVCLNITMGTPCHGDSGGPLVSCSGNACTQIGVVSFGYPLCMNVGLPAVFTRVTHYRDWIDANLVSLAPEIML